MEEYIDYKGTQGHLELKVLSSESVMVSWVYIYIYIYQNLTNYTLYCTEVIFNLFWQQSKWHSMEFIVSVAKNAISTETKYKKRAKWRESKMEVYCWPHHTVDANIIDNQQIFLIQNVMKVLFINSNNYNYFALFL